MKYIPRSELRVELYNLSVGETAVVAGNTTDAFATHIESVPGGWVYTTYDKSKCMMTSVFVPEEKEEN